MNDGFSYNPTHFGYYKALDGLTDTETDIWTVCKKFEGLMNGGDALKIYLNN